MSNHKGEPAKETGEIPVSLGFLSVINRLTNLYLLIVGLFYVLIGATWVLFQSPSRMAGIDWFNFLTSDMVGGVWVVSGLLSIIASFRVSHPFKQLGFFMLILTPTLMGMYFFMSWLIYVLPWISNQGYERAGVTTISYWTYSTAALIVARIYRYSVNITSVKSVMHP